MTSITTHPTHPRAQADTSWHKHAACKGKPAEWFFPVNPEDRERGLSVCRGCPVRIPCRKYGEEHENYGIWGGLIEKAQRARRAA